MCAFQEAALNQVRLVDVFYRIGLFAERRRQAAQADRAAPRTFTVGSARPSAERPGAFEVDLAATHTSSLDPIRGLVPARSTSTWLVRRETDAWRVSADPLAFRPVLPGDAAASAAVQGWVSRLASCDAPAATALQVTPNLYGPASLARTPCETQGTWTAGEPTGLDRTPDPRATTEPASRENGNIPNLDRVMLEFTGVKPERVAGSEFDIPADLVLLAMGFVHPEHPGIV